MKRWLLILMLLGGLGGACTYEPSSQEKKDEGFKYEFGLPPPAGVKVTHARLTGIRDSEQNRLRFETATDPRPFLLSRGLTKAERSERNARDFDEYWRSAPPWGRPEPESDYEFYECAKWPALNGLHWAQVRVAVSRSEHVVLFVCFRGG